MDVASAIIVAVWAAVCSAATRFLGDELFPVDGRIKAPDFERDDVRGRAGDEDARRLQGKVVLLNIWATWCAPCRIEMPSIQALHERYGPKGLKVVAVSIDNPGFDDAIREFRDQYGLTFEILHDPSGKIKRRLSDDRRARDVRHWSRWGDPQESHRRGRLELAGESRLVRAAARRSRRGASGWQRRARRGARFLCGPRCRAADGEPDRCSGTSRAALTERLGYKAAALFFALVLWFVVSAEEPSEELVPVRLKRRMIPTAGSSPAPTGHPGARCRSRARADQALRYAANRSPRDHRRRARQRGG